MMSCTKQLQHIPVNPQAGPITMHSGGVCLRFTTNHYLKLLCQHGANMGPKGGKWTVP